MLLGAILLFWCVKGPTFTPPPKAITFRYLVLCVYNQVSKSHALSNPGSQQFSSEAVIFGSFWTITPTIVDLVSTTKQIPWYSLEFFEHSSHNASILAQRDQTTI